MNKALLAGSATLAVIATLGGADRLSAASMEPFDQETARLPSFLDKVKQAPKDEDIKQRLIVGPLYMYKIDKAEWRKLKSGPVELKALSPILGATATLRFGGPGLK